VVIPVYNGAATLPTQLEALANQVGAPSFEVVVADNGSTDDTVQVAMAFADRLDLRVVRAAEQRGPSFARNRGVAVARSSNLLFCDADDQVAPTWVAAHCASLRADELVTGPVVYVDRPPSRAKWDPPDQRLPLAPRRYFDVMPFAPSNNLAMRAELFTRLGGFDTALRCTEDADLTIRAQLTGATLAWAPEAVVLNTRRATLRASSRQFFRYGFEDALLYRKLRGQGLPSRSPWQMLRPYLVLAATAHRVLRPGRRWSWVVNASQRAGRLVGSARFRVFCP
jgi:glycosyltransferase involved in cell wall biosynthesis